jgi:hypothetical protein
MIAAGHLESVKYVLFRRASRGCESKLSGMMTRVGCAARAINPMVINCVACERILRVRGERSVAESRGDRRARGGRQRDSRDREPDVRSGGPAQLRSPTCPYCALTP